MDTDKQIKRIVLDRMERCSVCHRDFEPDDVHVHRRQRRDHVAREWNVV